MAINELYTVIEDICSRDEDMICPHCHHVMIVVEHKDIEMDYCANCSGVWFDSGELELLLEGIGREASKLPLTELSSVPEARSVEKIRKCPICSQKMKKVHIGTHPGVPIDVCPQEEGLWFDGGEVGQVIRQCAENTCADSDTQESILDFLGDTFKAAERPEQK
jgi:Zn-finger nucleic acid-binding protein